MDFLIWKYWDKKFSQTKKKKYFFLHAESRQKYFIKQYEKAETSFSRKNDKNLTDENIITGVCLLIYDCLVDHARLIFA